MQPLRKKLPFKQTYLAFILETTFESLKVACFGESIITSNLGKTYSATWNVFENTWSTTLTTIFQSPKTGYSDNNNSPEKTPFVVDVLFHCLTLCPFPSWQKENR